MLKSVRPASIRILGPTAKLAENVQNRWLIGLEKTNPAILGMFRDRDVKPYRNLLPWSGEFAGKHITGAYYIWLLTRDQRLYEDVLGFIDRFIACQDADGYLGCFSRECRLTGAFSQTPDKTGETWDAWGHYHAMFGLIKWYEQTGREEYWQCVLKMADLLIRTFYNGRPPLVSIGSSEMNLAIMHAFVLIYEKTGDARYLEFARNVERDLPDPAAGDYLSYALNDMEFYQCPKPRWESLHVIMGIAEMYRATGDEKYLRAARQIFFSILKTDVHNTGAFSTDEQAVGNPYKSGAIETCCVLAYNAFGSQLMEMAGDLRIIDHLEKSHYNAIMGSFSPTGLWSTYTTPMDGAKAANFHDIVFQSRPGSPMLNCCSVNAPRGLGQIADWMLMMDGDALYVHAYESMIAELTDGMKLTVEGKYPYGGEVVLKFDSAGREMKLALRIPAWSKQTTITFRGESISCKAGEYAILNGVFAGEEIRLSLDFSIRIEKGAMDCEGKACVYAGPLLYGLDASANPGCNLDELPGWTAEELLNADFISCDDSTRILLPDGVVLDDFYHLGVTGCNYRTWLPLK